MRPFESAAASVALDAEKLRRFVREFASALEPEAQGALAESLDEFAARNAHGYRPQTPGLEAAALAEKFAANASAVGEARPEDVDRHLRAGNTAFLAADYRDQSITGSRSRRLFARFALPEDGASGGSD